MNGLILGLVLLLGGHSVSIMSPSLREAGVARLGRGGWQALYSLVAVIGLWLVISAYAHLRLAPEVLWVAPQGLKLLAAVLLLPVFPCLLAAYLPGQVRARLKHPMLVAVKAWALAHVLVVGTVASTVLFGSVLAWAVLDRISLKRRAPRPTPALPLSRWNDAIAIVVGLSLYAYFVCCGHLALIGVAPFG
jgi:uncharacterized membrane protein